jgi:uncharacterized lipoprotein YbaY
VVSRYSGLHVISRVFNCLLFAQAVFLLTACSDPGAPDETPTMSVVQGIVVPQHEITIESQYALKVLLVDVSLADTRTEVLAMQQLWGNSQWPVGYRLEYAADQIKPGHRYAIRVRLEDSSGQLLAITDQQHAVEPGTAQELQRDVMISAVAGNAAKRIQAVRIQCDAVAFTGQFANQYLILRKGEYGRVSVLESVVSASGAHYRSASAELWNKGNKALLSYEGVEYRDCLVSE